MDDSLVCPYCSSKIPLFAYDSHIDSHEASLQSDEDLARRLAAEDEQALNEAAALKLVESDVANREKFESKSSLSAIITSPEQIAQMAQGPKGEQGAKLPTAVDISPQFLAYVDKTHKKTTSKETDEISHVILFDVDNCGGEFEQIADAVLSFHKILVYVVGGPGLPNVSNVKLPILAEMHQRKRLHIIPMTKKGKNAADFVLSFYGGVLHERLPLHIPFMIVSKDKGLSQLVEHLGLLGRAAQLISSEIVKHLSVKPFMAPTTTTTATTTTTTTTTPSTTTSTTDPGTQSTLPPATPATNATSSLLTGENPFVENAPPYTLEQAVWFVISGISKIEAGQRAKTVQKLENTISGLVKRIPGKRDHLATSLLIEEMQRQNLIFVDGAKIVYLF